MALTPLPIPRITAPNWGAQLNNAITSRYTDLLARITKSETGVTAMPAATGVTATDDAALAAAIALAGSRGVVQAAVGTYKISSHHVIPSGVDLRGMGAGSTSKTGTTTFLCTTAGSQIEFAGGGGISGDFEIDGDSVATTPFKRSGGVGANGRTFHPISVRDNLPAGNTNDLALFHGAQNDLWFQLNLAGADRDLRVFDQGYGGAMFIRCELHTAGRYHDRYDDQVAGGVYDSPSDIHHLGGILEGLTGDTMVGGLAAGTISYDGTAFISINGCADPMIDIGDGYFSFHDLYLQNTPVTQVPGSVGLRCKNSAVVVLSGRTLYLNPETQLVVDGSISFIYDHSAGIPSNTTTPRAATGGANVNQIAELHVASGIWALTGVGEYVILSQNQARNAQRFAIRADGRIEWYPGNNFTPDTQLVRRQAGAIGLLAGTQQLMCMGMGTTAQRPAWAAALEGAVYVNTDTNSMDWADDVQWRTVHDHTWTALTTSNITTNPNGTGAAVGWTKIDGKITLRGLAAGVNVAGATLFTLPAGARPGFTTLVPILCFGVGGATVVPGYLNITTAGVCSIPIGSGTLVSFEGISFVADN